jgi:hypothetical protein
MGNALATVIAQATARSATFRRLVHAIGESNGIVYVEHGRCGHSARACLLDVTAAATNRIVRVRVEAHKIDWDLMGSIGHELQHAVEVLGEPKITSTAAMHAFYRQNGRFVANVFETPAAIQAGNAVRTETRHPHRSTPVR